MFSMQQTHFVVGIELRYTLAPVAPSASLPECGKYILCRKQHFCGLRVFEDGTCRLQDSHRPQDGLSMQMTDLDLSVYTHMYQLCGIEDGNPIIGAGNAEDFRGGARQEDTSEEDCAFHGLLVQADNDGGIKYQPWNTAGQPMLPRFINAHNMAVWLRYTVLPHHVAAEALLAFAQRVPANIGWRMLLVSAQQCHCAWQDVGLVYIKACLLALGLAEHAFVRHLDRYAMEVRQRWPNLRETLPQLGVPQWVADCVVEDATVTSANQELWQENAVLVPRQEEALLEAGCLHVVRV